MAVSDLLVKADAVYQSAASYLNALVVALAILFVGFIIARVTGTALSKLFTVIEFDDWCTGLFGPRRKYARATRITIVRTLYIITVYLALRSLQLAGVAITLIAGIFVVILLVSLLMLAFEFLPNLVGHSRLRARHIDIGDEVDIDYSSGRISGKVVGMNLLEMRVRRSGGDLVFLPNAALSGVRITKRRSKK